MPTARDFRGGSKTPMSELKLNLPVSKSDIRRQTSTSAGTRSTTTTATVKKPPTKKSAYEHCGHPTKEHPNVSRATLSIQNLNFCNEEKTKPLLRVPANANIKVVEEKESSQSTPIAKTRGYDLTSSTNSHFEGWLLAVPKKFKRHCSKSSKSSSDIGSKSTSLQSSEPNKKPSDDPVTSQEMIDSQHDDSPKRVNFNGPEWKKPCDESFVAGAPRAYVGTCPPNYEEIVKMSKPRQKFFLTQDPRQKYCLRNPETLHRKKYTAKKEFDALTKMVKHADNVCVGSESVSSASILCEEIDLENPLRLDFQGLDYADTYYQDEQDMQNQRLYRRICRFMERKRVKAETEVLAENELFQERLAVPKCFDVEDRNEDIKSTTTEESLRYGKLLRAIDKPFNQGRIAEENSERRDRYKDLYLRRKAKAEKEKEKREIEKKEKEDAKGATLAVKNFESVVKTIDTAIQSSKLHIQERRKPPERRVFPNNMSETNQFKKALKQKNRIKRDEAIVKQEFFLERCGVEKNYPEALLEISSDTNKYSEDVPISEQSSNDEDALEVGKVGDEFKLRGFHYKLGDNLRGKSHQTAVRKEKGCMTREQWLAQLAPKKEQVKLDVEVGIENFKSPDDPNLNLFPPTSDYKPPKAKKSAIRQFTEKQLGRHYDRTIRRNLRIVKPRLQYSVKKFNLIRYLYDDQKMLKDVKKYLVSDAESKAKTVQAPTTLEYMAAKEKRKKIEHDLIQQKRLELLGIPCKPVRKSSFQKLCENSDSGEDSDWVPDAEPDIISIRTEIDTLSIAKSIRLPMRMRGNMPAPKFRETTLRRHPRHPRDYLSERVPSEVFDKVVKQSDKPYMRRLSPDIVEYSNVGLPKRPYTDKFEARHHHDHWDPTQLNRVDIHYLANIVNPNATESQRESDKILLENFRMANPPCNAFINMDLTMPNFNIDGMIAAHNKRSERSSEEITQHKLHDVCRTRDFVYRSRPQEVFKDLDYPGRKEYLDFLHEIRDAFNQRSQDHNDADAEKPKLFVDKEAIYRELEEDLKSIESCLTSLSSSECTNLTNDSGSFLLLEGKTKVPLDYIRKSLVPFEELNRSRFQAEPIDVAAEEANPFNVLPFSGQKKSQLELTTAKDSFFTFNTRLRNGLRLRLEVPVEDVRQKLIGRGKKKYPSLVTTDIDENYVDELKNRPPVKMFNFKSGRSFIKDALRLKFESMLIQGQIVRTKIYDRLNEQHWTTMQKTKAMYEYLFAKWEKKEYEAAMSVVHQVKSYYDVTDILKREFRELEKEQLILNMDIVFIEGHWIRRIMLQNFHYLLGDQEWRYANDWIHRVEKPKRDENGDHNDEDDDEIVLENFEESIAKRTTANIRQREKDDALAIKAFYEDVYLKNKHPILIVFPDADSFLQGIENLKVKTFVLLLELHFTLSIHTELQGRLETFVDWCVQDLKEKSEYVDRKCAKKYFMSDRAEELRRRTLEYLDKPIEMSFNDAIFNKDRSVIAEVWRQMVPASLRGSSDQEQEPITMVAMMSEVVMELINKFESIPAEKSHRAEMNLRRRRAYLRKLSAQAYQVEKRIEKEMQRVRKNLEPPYQKPKKVGKLPRLFIKKKTHAVVVEEKRISESTKFFFRAFNDEGEVMRLNEARDSLFVINTIQEQIVPFYFDHFLKSNGYTPNYNFKTNIDLRDGPEAGRFKVQSVLPEVIERMEKWETHRKRVMEDNIARNPQMYENVNF